MGQVTIQLYGICTNFRQADNPTLPVAHRVLLIRTDNRPLPPKVPVHFPQLYMPGEAPLLLQGWTLDVKNATGSGVTYDASYFNAPTMQTLMDGNLPEPSTQVLLDRDPTLVACYVDLTAASVSSCGTSKLTGRNAAITQIVVATDGDPIIRLTAFPGAPPPPFHEMAISSGSLIGVMNRATNETTSEPDNHFVLHYFAASAMPLPPVIPTTIDLDLCGQIVRSWDGTGPGCSDSNYP